MRGVEAGLGLEAIEGDAEPRFLVLSLLQSLAHLPEGLGSGGEDRASERALRILQDHLGLAGVGLFAAHGRVRFAQLGIPSPAEDFLWDKGSEAESLMDRVAEEERIILLGRRSAEPSLNRMRQLGLDWQCLALIPLGSASGRRGILVLAAGDGTMLSPEILGALHPVFRFLAGTLPPLQDPEGRPCVDGALPSIEDLEAELEALRSRNSEVEDLLRAAEEASASVAAARRVEIEDARVQIAELESSLAGVGVVPEEVPCEACVILHKAADDDAMRIRLLEQEVEQLRLAAEVLPNEEDREPDSEDVVSAAPDQGTSAQTGSLGAIADAVMAELVGDASEPIELSVEFQSDPPPAVQPPLAEADAVASAEDPWVVCCSADSLGRYENLTSFAQAQEFSIASPESAAAPTGRKLWLLNLLSDDPEKLPASMGGFGAADRIVGFVASGDQGAALGELGWLASDLSPDQSFAEIVARHGVPTHTLVVSERLREMAPLREALTEQGSSVAMACDARQALDLLEIVQKPDAAILDLAADSAAILALATRLHQENESANLQIFLLAPEISEPLVWAQDPVWGEVFQPFGGTDLQRLIALSIRLH